MHRPGLRKYLKLLDDGGHAAAGYNAAMTKTGGEKCNKTSKTLPSDDACQALLLTQEGNDGYK